jgi:hypothetical protein
MTAVAYAHPTIIRFAIADGILHIGGLPVGSLAERAPVPPHFSPTSAPASPGARGTAPCPAGRHPPQLRGQGQSEARRSAALQQAGRRRSSAI